MPTEIKADARTWAIPPQPEDVKLVMTDSGELWRKTDAPALNDGESYWVEVAPSGSPFSMSWGGLMRSDGPLTEVAE